MKFFNDCKTIEEVKALYKKMAMENHPDRGGDTATMQAINTEYAFACAKLAKGAGLSDEEADTEIRLSEEYRQVIEKIINLPGIVIEIVGNWIWVTGETKPVKETLKEAGFISPLKKLHGITAMKPLKQEATAHHWNKYAPNTAAKKSTGNSRTKFWKINF